MLSNMPLKKEISRLDDLCIQSIAENVIWHSHASRTLAHDEEIQFRYHIFQRHFGDLCLEQLCRTHLPSPNADDSETKCLSHFLFQESKRGEKNSKTWLSFIFNKYRKQIFLHCPYCVGKEIPEEITSYILSNCKDAQDLDLQFSNLNEADFLTALPQLSNLVKLNISSSCCTEQMLCKIWDALPYLQELYAFNSPIISDKCLQHLCSRYSKCENFYLCEANGFCNEIEKRLRILDVRGTRISQAGIVCALLHLKSLEYLHHSNFGYSRRSILNAVLNLREVVPVKKCQRLKLKAINFCLSLEPSKMRSVLIACPHLEDVRVWALPKYLKMLTRNFVGSINRLFLHVPSSEIFDSMVFKTFLLKYGGQLDKLAISAKCCCLKVQHITEILRNCKKLKEFSIAGEWEFDDVKDSLPEILTSIENLQVLDLCGFCGSQSSRTSILLETLDKITNLKTLAASWHFFKHVTWSSFEVMSLKNLETFVMYGADLSSVSLECFVIRQNNLRKIILLNCKNVEGFLRSCKDISRKSNFLLNIKCKSISKGIEYLPPFFWRSGA